MAGAAPEEPRQLVVVGGDGELVRARWQVAGSGCMGAGGRGQVGSRMARVGG